MPRDNNQEADILSKELLIAAGILRTEKEQQGEESSMCPKCGALMVLRLAQHGTNAGNHFYGCSHYPKCTFTKSVEKNEVKEKSITKLKVKKYHQEGDPCPKNCGGILHWESKKMTEKRKMMAYHYEKWLKCNECGAIFFEEKYKVIHDNKTNSLL